MSRRLTLLVPVLVLVLVFHVAAADNQRAVRFFAYHKQLTPAPQPRLFTRDTISELVSARPVDVDCLSLSSQYRSAYQDEGDRPLDQLQEICRLVTSCQTAASLQRVVALIRNNTSNMRLSDAVTDLCPVLLSQSKDQACFKNGMMVDDSSSTQTANSPLVVWGTAFLCVTIISLTSLVGVVIVPFLNKASYLNVLNLFEGLAVGSLVGSSLFHLIPQAFDLNTSPNKHQYLWKALIIFFGIYLFYWSERIMNLISNSQEQSKAKEAADQPNGDPKAESSNTLEQRLRTVSDVIAAGHTHAHEHAHLTGGKKKIATVAWMIIFGDGLHNFIDGLSIGAAFNQSILTGISICVAVVAEEFPHELGDFAVLIASGMSIRQAVSFNFLSACTCYAGMVLGICVGDLGPTYIFALAGGMFLYIALVNMMSELTAAVETASKHSVRQTLKVLCLQNTGILSGIACLFVLAKYSEYIHFG